MIDFWSHVESSTRRAIPFIAYHAVIRALAIALFCFAKCICVNTFKIINIFLIGEITIIRARTFEEDFIM